MGLETAATVGSLVATNPLVTDLKNAGDDHFRLIKSVMQADVASKSAANTFSSEMVLLSSLTVGGKCSMSSLSVPGIASFSAVSVSGGVRVDGHTVLAGGVSFGTTFTVSAVAAALSGIRVDGITSLASVASTRGDFGAFYLSGTITASTQVVSKQYADAAMAQYSPVTLYEVTNTSDITINAADTATGISIAGVVIPTNGTIQVLLSSARILAGGVASGVLSVGIKVNGVTHKIKVTGEYNMDLDFHKSIAAGQYEEWNSTFEPVAGTDSAFKEALFDIAGTGIATGSQTVELILKVASSAATLKGTAKTTRLKLVVTDYSNS